MKIKPASISDVPHLPSIERSAGEAFRQIADLAWIADDDVQSEARHLELIESGAAWVAVDDEDRLVGFLSAEAVGSALHVWEVAVRSTAQGKGVGRALIIHALEWASTRDFQSVTLTTFRDVRWNEPFYQSLGFRTLAEPDLSPRLRAILNDEAKAGLPRAKRCAMVLSIGRARHVHRSAGGPFTLPTGEAFS